MGPFTYDVHQKMGFSDPLPPCRSFNTKNSFHMKVPQNLRPSFPLNFGRCSENTFEFKKDGEIYFLIYERLEVGCMSTKNLNKRRRLRRGRTWNEEHQRNKNLLKFCYKNLIKEIPKY